MLARNPLLGERDPRSEDRQLLLDAVMSASEKLPAVLHRRRPRHRHVPAAGDPAVRAARRGGGHRRERCPPRHRDPASVAAVRCTQLPARAPVQLRPGGAGRCPRRAAPARTGARIPAGAVGAAAAGGRRSRRPHRVPGAPDAGVSAATARVAGPRRGRGPRRRTGGGARSAGPVGSRPEDARREAGGSRTGRLPRRGVAPRHVAAVQVGGVGARWTSSTRSSRSSPSAGPCTSGGRKPWTSMSISAPDGASPAPSAGCTGR